MVDLFMSLLYNLSIQSSIHNYNVTFIDDFKQSLNKINKSDDVIIIDSKIIKLYDLGDLIRNWRHIEITASENQKSYQSLAPIIEKLINLSFRKNNRLVAIGGGITQDVTGFISSIIFRGVVWLFFPTTLLAQGDSCIGGKTSINFETYKNQIGNFYPPSEIYIDVSFTDTLSDLEYRSGVGEMCHFFLISGERDYQFFKREYLAALNHDKQSLVRLISRCLEIKKSYIELDEFDRKERLILNYGHSFGHAIESITDYKIPHGIAVTYGMDLANYISTRLNRIPKNLFKKLHQMFKIIWNGTDIGSIDIERFINALKKDKKNIGSDLRVILTKGIGSMFIDQRSLDKNLIGYFQKYFSEIVNH